MRDTAPNTQISGAVYIKGGSKSNTFEYTTAIYTTLFSLAITLYQQPAFHFFPTLLLFLSYSVSYLSNPRSTHLYSDPYSIPGWSTTHSKRSILCWRDAGGNRYCCEANIQWPYPLHLGSLYDCHSQTVVPPYSTSRAAWDMPSMRYSHEKCLRARKDIS